MSWEDEIKRGEHALLFWYRKITKAGHGHISIDISKNSGKITIEPTPTIRDEEAQSVFDNLNAR